MTDYQKIRNAIEATFIRGGGKTVYYLPARRVWGTDKKDTERELWNSGEIHCRQPAVKIQQGNKESGLLCRPGCFRLYYSADKCQSGNPRRGAPGAERDICG